MLDGWLKEGLAPSFIIDRHRDSVPAPHHLVRSRMTFRTISIPR